MSSAYDQHRLPRLRALDALASPERRLLLWLLNEGELSVSELVERSGLRQPSVSKHLCVLREAGVVGMGGDWHDRRLRIHYLRWEPFLEVERWLADMRGSRYGGTPFQPSRELEEQRRYPERFTTRGTRRIRNRFYPTRAAKERAEAAAAAEWQEDSEQPLARDTDAFSPTLAEPTQRSSDEWR